MARHQTRDQIVHWPSILEYWRSLHESEYRQNMSRLKNLILLKKEMDDKSSGVETGLVLMNLPAPVMSTSQPKERTMLYVELIEYLTENLGRVLYVFFYLMRLIMLYLMRLIMLDSCIAHSSLFVFRKTDILFYSNHSKTFLLSTTTHHDPGHPTTS